MVLLLEFVPTASERYSSGGRFLCSFSGIPGMKRTQQVQLSSSLLTLKQSHLPTMGQGAAVTKDPQLDGSNKRNSYRSGDEEVRGQDAS